MENHVDDQKVMEKLEESEVYYSDDRFWAKLKKYAKKAGSSVVYSVLLLYYTLQKPEVPKKTKAIIIGGLGYFILPIDFIPDMLVGVGYTDDLSALGIALFQVAMYIDDDVKHKAKIKLKDWFGENVNTSVIDLKIQEKETKG